MNALNRILPAQLAALLTSGVLLVACAGGGPAPASAAAQGAELVPNAHAPLPGVLTGGQPDAGQLSAIADAGYRTVVNLRTAGETSPIEDERAAVESLGLRYVAIPVAGADGLTEENVRALSAVLDDDDAYPVVIHCASGNRVGALLALEAAWIDEVAPEKALELGLDGGLTRLEPAVREKLGLPAPEQDR